MKDGRDKKGNITASFGNDLVTEGYTSVPNLILKYYPKLGMTDSEMMLVIQMLRLKSSSNNPFPSLEQIADCMAADSYKIKGDLAGLIEKDIIAISYYYDEIVDEVMSTYTLEPLFETISEFWACEKVKNLQKMKKALQEKELRDTRELSKEKSPLTQVYKTFEKEFGRLLSPMELEQISNWLKDFNGNSELILEALKRAVFLGKHNFKYIDSILLEWQKNNLRSVKDVQDYEVDFRQRQANKKKGYQQRKVSEERNSQDKFRLLYLR